MKNYKGYGLARKPKGYKKGGTVVEAARSDKKRGLETSGQQKIIDLADKGKVQRNKILAKRSKQAKSPSRADKKLTARMRAAGVK